VTPQLLSVYFRSRANLSLGGMECRLTPDLYSLVMAAKQRQDDFVVARGRRRRRLPLCGRHRRAGCEEGGVGEDEPASPLRMGIERAEVPRIGGTARIGQPMPGQPAVPGSVVQSSGCGGRGTRAPAWKSAEPVRHVFVPPEDEPHRELPTATVRDQAMGSSGDLARSRSSRPAVMDGTRHTREPCGTGTPRPLREGDPPRAGGSIEVVVFLYDVVRPSALHQSRYVYAEHSEESTLAFYATDHMKN